MIIKTWKNIYQIHYLRIIYIIKSNNNIITILNKPSKINGKSVKSSDEAMRKKDKCYNNINNCKKNRLMIKEHFNYEIKEFFEN